MQLPTTGTFLHSVIKEQVSDPNFDQVCRIVSFGGIPDGEGGSLVGELLDDSNVPCRVIPNVRAQITEGSQGGIEFGSYVTQFHFPLGTEISRDNAIDFSGERYEVVGVLSPTSSEVFVKVEAKLFRESEI